MIIFSDMDGTFLSKDKSIAETNWRALDALAEAGIEFVPCSGRPFTGLKPELLQHPAVHYAVTANGASVYEVATGKILHRVCLGRERAHRLWDVVRERDATFDILSDGSCYTTRELYGRIPNFLPDPFILASMKASRIPLDIPMAQIIDEAPELERVSMLCTDPDERKILWAASERLGHVSVVCSSPRNIEVADAEATKGLALTWLCDYLGMGVADAVAFGDNFNDITMLEAAGRGVAMANADPAARAAADEVCGSNEEGGVGRFVLGLLQQAPRHRTRPSAGAKRRG